MSVTSGFFNSQNGDRKYTAEQFSELFNSLITDGVFSNIGSAFMVSAGSSGMTVNVGVGRSWFDSIWLYNDALLPIALSPSEVLLNRIDAVVIEVDKAEGVRAGSIKIVEGTPLSTPSKPVLTKDANVTQYPLAYIYVAAGATSITQANITNAVGTSECPYVTGILKTQEIDNIVAQWQSEFDIWFENLDVTLSGDVAANLASQVLDLYSRFDDLATYGSVYSDLEDSNGNKIMDNNGLVIQGRTTFANEGEVSGSSDEPGGSVPVEVEDTFKVGDILMTARTDLGNNWLLCNGELVDEPTYPSLYAQIPDPKIFVVSSWSSVIDLPETAPANDTATVLKTFIKREQFIYAAFLKGNGYKYYAYIYKFDNTGQLIDSLENYLVNFEYTRWSGGSFEVVNGRLYIAGVDSNGSSDDDILIYSWNVNDLSETPTTNSIPSSATVNANYNEFFLSSMGNYMYLAASNSTNVGIIYANLLNLNSWSTCMAKNHSSKSTGISFRKIGEDALIYQTVTEHGTSSSYSHPCGGSKK